MVENISLNCFLTHSSRGGLDLTFSPMICSIAGWQELGKRGSGAVRKVRVFYERKDGQRYSVAKLRIVAMYTLFERLL